MRAPSFTRRTGEREQIFSPYLVWIIWLLWMFFLYQPISELAMASPSVARTLSLLFMTVYIGLYLWITWQNAWRLTRSTPEGVISEPAWREWGPIALMLALGVAAAFVQGQSALGSLIYVSAALCARLTAWRAALAAVGLTLLTVLLGVITHSPPSAVLQIVFIVPAVGLFVYFFGHAIRTNQELRRARQEIARLAVSEERLRFARDLHDLLGHTLSLITLKSELARRLVSVAPEQAAVEIGDIETAARQALVEVREAVSGYRQPTLHSELSGARELLDAAGIAYTQQGEAPLLAPPIEAALSWAVREGVTNVIRHSRAKSCVITFAQQRGQVSVEVRDDGRAAHEDDAASEDVSGGASARAIGGSGLAGLKERIAALGGSCEAGAINRGWRLTVSLPIAAEAAQAAQTDATEATEATEADASAETQAGKRAEKGISAWFG